MLLRDAFKEHYLLEGTRRAELMTALAVPVAILTLVLGALAVVAKEIHVPFNLVATVQLTLVVLGAVACALCTYFVFRSLYGLAYAFVPTPLELSTYRDQLVTYHIASGKTPEDAAKVSEDETLTYLYGEYAKNADRNSINNDIKSGFIHNANSTLIAAVVLAAGAGVTYTFASVSSSPSVPKVEIVNLPMLLHSSSPVPLAAASSSPPPSAPPPPAPPVRPEPPPSKVIREHTTPPPPPVPPKR